MQGWSLRSDGRRYAIFKLCALRALKGERGIHSVRGRIIVHDRAKLLDSAEETCGHAEEEYRRLLQSTPSLFNAGEALSSLELPASRSSWMWPCRKLGVKHGMHPTMFTAWKK